MPQTQINLKPVVRYREFPFGITTDPSMTTGMASTPQAHQEKILQYLSSGHIIGYPMGAGLVDWFDKTSKANVCIQGKWMGGTTPMSDGIWFWYAGLIHFVEKYNVAVCQEFVEHAASQDWRIPQLQVRPQELAYSYFDDNDENGEE